MKPLRYLPPALVVMLTLLVSSIAWAQATPPSPPSLPTLSVAAVVALVLPLTIGLVNQAVQTGKALNQVPLAASALPWLTLLGSFLTGASAYLTTVSFAITPGTVVYAVAAGVASFFVASSPHVVASHFQEAADARLSRAATLEKQGS